MIDGYFVGIDPGASGAIALLNNDGFFAGVWDYPGDPVLLERLLRKEFDHRIVRLAVIEQVHSMPAQGVSSCFKFGCNYGIWQMACASMKWPTELVTTIRWRKCLDSSVPAKPEKQDIINYARRRWPEAEAYLLRKKDDSRAEAICISAFALSRIKETI